MDPLRTAFVTGAGGYIGRPVALALRRAGYRVLGLVRDAAKAGGLAADEIVPVVGTLQDADGWRAAAAAADVLVHAAIDYRGDTMALDRATVERLVAIAGPRRAALVYTSGAWVHGDTGGGVADESWPLAPIAVVAERPATERLVLGAPGARGIVIRPGIVYGRRGGLTAALFDAQPVVGDGRNRWPMVHVDDLADAYVLAAERGRAGSAYIAVDRSRRTVAELAAAARAAAGLHGEPRWQPLAEARDTLGAFADALALDQQLSAARAQRELGWRPRHPEFVADAAVYAAANGKAAARNDAPASATLAVAASLDRPAAAIDRTAGNGI
jgi:nucleoside-diphosphate-sugar epimerase